MNRFALAVALKKQNARALGKIGIFFHRYRIRNPLDDFLCGQSIGREFIIPMFGNPHLPGEDQLLDRFDERAQSFFSDREVFGGLPGANSSKRTSNTLGQNFPVRNSRSPSGS